MKAGLVLAFCLIIGSQSQAIGGRVKSGTGFFVRPDGYLITSAHVVSDCQYVSIWTQSGKRYETQLVDLDPKQDIALLRPVGEETFDVQTPFVKDGVFTGDKVFAMGYGVDPKNPRRAIQTAGTYVGTIVISDGVKVRVIKAQLQRGESGGPVLNTGGALLGMVIGHLADRRDRGVILPSDDILKFLNGRGVLVPLASERPAANPRDILWKITVLVQCTAKPKSSLQNKRDGID